MAVILYTQPISMPLSGELRPPGDKSISHRALILASLADGESRITGLLDAEDVRATAQACRQLGATVRSDGDLTLVTGTGQQGLSPPAGPLDMGNSGTAMRLLAGVLAAQPFESVLVGDESLSRRPMRRIVEPLQQMGARIETSAAGTAPLRIRGNPHLRSISYRLPVASAQVKSCILLAGLYAEGRTCAIEPETSRDHTEKMLPTFGVRVEEPCCVTGGSKLAAARIAVPGDISSAAFLAAAAALVPGSELLLLGVGLNATRDGLIRVMHAMGADVDVLQRRLCGREEVGDVRVRHSGRLAGVDVPVDWVPALIDELPVIMALAACARGVTRIRGAAELRVKESDRIAVMAQGLAALGIAVQEHPDGIDIEGGTVGEGSVDGAGDHRCAMSFAILGQVASGPIAVHGAGHIATSYPGFPADLRGVGGNASVSGPSEQ